MRTGDGREERQNCDVEENMFSETRPFQLTSSFELRTKKEKRRKYLLTSKSYCSTTVLKHPLVVRLRSSLKEDLLLIFHRFMLAMGSDVFQKQLYGPCKEAIEQITVANWKAKVFRLVVEYLYSDRTPDLTKENAMDVLKCAEEYHISNLVVKCQVLIFHDLRTSGAVNGVLFAMAKVKSVRCSHTVLLITYAFDLFHMNNTCSMFECYLITDQVTDQYGESAGDGQLRYLSANSESTFVCWSA